MPDLQKLSKIALSSLLARENKYSSLIQKQLLNALTTIYGEMTKIYKKYAKDGKLTKVEMTKYNKYSTMEKDILSKIDPAIKANIQTIKKLLPSQFQESFYHYAWALDEAVQVNLSWGMVNTKVLLAPFDITNPKNIELQQALKNYGPTAKKRIQKAMLDGLTLGKSYDQMARDLKKAMNKIYSSAITIVRTEGQSAINAGQTLVYNRAIENGVNGKEIWNATKDARTRYDHRHADGTERNKDGYFEVGGELALYPGDPNLSAENRINCRCEIIFVIDGYEPELMRTREEGIIEYSNYDNYVKRYHPDWEDKEIKSIAKKLKEV